MNAKQRATAFSWAVLAAMVAAALFVARLFVLAVTGQPLALPGLGALRGPVVVALQVAALALIMWKALPAFLTRYDRKVTALEAALADERRRNEKMNQTSEAAVNQWRVVLSRAKTAEARLESAGALITELRAERDQWKAAAGKARKETDAALLLMEDRDKVAWDLNEKLEAAIKQRDEAREFARSAAEESGPPPALRSVVAFLRDVQAMEERSERAVPPLFRKHGGKASNSAATFAAVRELLELLDERAGEGVARGTEQAQSAEQGA